MAWDSFLRFGVLAYIFYTLVLYPRGGFTGVGLQLPFSDFFFFSFFTLFCIWLVGQLGGIRIDRVARAATQGTNAGATRIGPKLLERIWWLSVLYPGMVVAWDDSFLHFFLLSVSMYPYLHTFHFFSHTLSFIFCILCYYIRCNIVCLFTFFCRFQPLFPFFLFCWFLCWFTC